VEEPADSLKIKAAGYFAKNGKFVPVYAKS
jgi:hypothetical protein